MGAYFSSLCPSVSVVILETTGNLLQLEKLKTNRLRSLLLKHLRVEMLLCPRISDVCHFNLLVSMTSELFYCCIYLPQRHHKCCFKHSHTFLPADKPLRSYAHCPLSKLWADKSCLWGYLPLRTEDKVLTLLRAHHWRGFLHTDLSLCAEARWSDLPTHLQLLPRGWRLCTIQRSEIQQSHHSQLLKNTLKYGGSFPFCYNTWSGSLLDPWHCYTVIHLQKSRRGGEYYCISTSEWHQRHQFMLTWEPIH